MRRIVNGGYFISAFLMWMVFLVSCAIEFEVESQRTIVEQQILGAYEELDDDLIMVSSVRAVKKNGQKTETKLTTLEKRAVAAKQNQQFNQDDLRELLDKQIIGEMKDAKITMLPSKVGRVSKAKETELILAKLIVDEENRDRSVIWQRVIEKAPDLSNTDLGLVRENYHKQLVEKLTKGHWFQNSEGKWVQKN